MGKFKFSNILNGLKNFGTFLITKDFLKQLGIAVGAAFLILFLTFQMLAFFTHHGDSLSVPDFSGSTLKEANNIADENDLRIEISDSVYNAPGRKGTIIAQTPPPDFKVKKGRTIHVVIKTLNPEQIDMPDITGVSLIQAKADIETYGLRIGKLKYVPDIATNNVLEQMYKGKPIAPGTRIEKYSKIDLILGLGKAGSLVAAPNLIGSNKSQAIKKATDNSLNIGALLFDESVITTEDTASAIIWKQSPTTNRQVMMGSSIDLWFTLDSTKISKQNQDEL